MSWFLHHSCLNDISQIVIVVKKMIQKICRHTTMAKPSKGSLAKKLHEYSEVATVHGVSYVFSRFLLLFHKKPLIQSYILILFIAFKSNKRIVPEIFTLTKDMEAQKAKIDKVVRYVHMYCVFA